MGSNETGYESRLFIDNAFVDAKTNKYLDVFNPVTGALVGRVQAAGTDDVNTAVQSAARAFNGEWAQFTGQQRRIRVLAFTGSPHTGKIIAELAAKSNMKRTVLELGGKAAAIVFDDYPVESTLEACATMFVALSGQACTASTMVLVHSSIVEEFTEKMKASFEAMASAMGGDPTDPATSIGPLADEKQLQHVLRRLDLGKEGGRVLTGGSRHGTTGCYVQRTIFVDVKEDARIWREEMNATKHVECVTSVLLDVDFTTTAGPSSGLTSMMQ